MRAIGIGVVLAAVVALGAPSATGAQAVGERECVRLPPEPKYRAMDGYIEARKSMGFRADEAYIRKLIRRGLWYFHHWLPVTPREKAYLRLRDRLDIGDAARRYLHRHKDLDGGRKIQDDWPRGPYLVQQLTRERAKHTAALKRLVPFPDNLRTQIVALSYRQLRRIANDVQRADHDADGFDVEAAMIEEGRNLVRIYLITKRTDHREYFRERYGPRVRTVVMATEPTAHDCAPLHGWRPGATPNEVEVWWDAGGSGVFHAAEVVELPDRVEVAIVAVVPAGFRTADSRPTPHTITLSAPLGDRPLISTTTGRRLRLYEPFSPP